MIQSLILAGGFGTRLREETEFKPKPMVEVGGRPILWHIMKNMSTQNINNFILAIGYKGEIIKDYFLNYHSRNNDVTIQLGDKSSFLAHGDHAESDWRVTIANTGDSTMTGGRVFRVRNYIGNERFICTYGDGLADIDLSKLLKFHESSGKIATVTTVQPLSRFGIMDVDKNGIVSSFKEKPVMEGWVNAGFFVFEPEIFDYLDEDCVLEQEPLAELASIGELAAYRHEGFWQPMDTIREAKFLNDLWSNQEAPWKNWK